MSDGRRKGRHRLIEFAIEPEVSEGMWKRFYILIKFIPKGKVSERRRKGRHWFVECNTESEVGDRIWEVVNRLVKVSIEYNLL